MIDFCEKKGFAKYKWPEKFDYVEIPRNPAGKIENVKVREKFAKAAKEALDKEIKPRISNKDRHCQESSEGEH